MRGLFTEVQNRSRHNVLRGHILPPCDGLLIPFKTRFSHGLFQRRVGGGEPIKWGKRIKWGGEERSGAERSEDPWRTTGQTSGTLRKDNNVEP